MRRKCERKRRLGLRVDVAGNVEGLEMLEVTFFAMLELPDFSINADAHYHQRRKMSV
jgi:hypothetical protein